MHGHATLKALLWLCWCTIETIQQVKIVSGNAESQVQLNLLEDLGVSGNSLDAMNSLLQTVSSSALQLNSKKFEAYSETQVSFIGGLRNNNQITYFLMRNGLLRTLEVFTDATGFVKMQESYIADLTNSTSGGKLYPSCTNLVMSLDRVFILCKEMVSGSSSIAILKIFSFLKLDFTQSSQHKLEMSGFTYQTTVDRPLEGVLCSFKSGSEIIDYLAVYETPTKEDSPTTSLIFFYTLKDHKLKPGSVNILNQLTSFTRLLTFGCNANPVDNNKYLFLTSTDTTKTYIVPITDNLLVQLFNDQKFVPVTKPTQYTVGNGVIVQSALSMGSTSQVLVLYADPKTETYRLARTQLLFVSLDVATINSKFLADLDGTANTELFPAVKSSFVIDASAYRFRQIVNSMLFSIEYRPTAQSKDPMMLEILTNQNNIGAYAASRKIVLRTGNYLVTPRSSSSPVTNEPEYLISSQTSDPSSLAPSSKFVSTITAFSLSNTNFDLSAATLKNGTTFISKCC